VRCSALLCADDQEVGKRLRYRLERIAPPAFLYDTELVLQLKNLLLPDLDLPALLVPRIRLPLVDSADLVSKSGDLSLIRCFSTRWIFASLSVRDHRPRTSPAEVPAEVCVEPLVVGPKNSSSHRRVSSFMALCTSRCYVPSSRRGRLPLRQAEEGQGVSERLGVRE
jgi:hypothetical protein